MPRKKENPATQTLPGFDIFGQPLATADSGVLLKTTYRRKQLAGFVPLWNEFFRCYHLAGVSPNAVYLWAYLRQHEHERREWNAVSDISWLGRRDIADSLGVSISHLPNLLEELRRAGLLCFQPVLPGFEELADALNTTTEAVRDRAADYGVTPKVDGTLYRTADPHTRTEFAALTNLKYCKACKAYRYCDGVKEVQNKALANNEKATAKLKAPAPQRQVEVNLPIINRTQEVTATVSTKNQSPTLDRLSDRINNDTDTVSKKKRPANLGRIKTMHYEPSSINQLDKSTNQTGLVVETSAKTTSQPITNPNVDLLLKFGFDQQSAQQLAAKVVEYNKPPGYVETILRYARENARQNPPGLARHLIERGEERLTRAGRWQQQALFEVSDAGEEIAESIPATANNIAAAPQAVTQDWWQALIITLHNQNSFVAQLLGRGSGKRNENRLIINLPNLLDRRRAEPFADVFERAIADATGEWYKIEFVC
jgi:hypothetical protein